MSQVYCRNCFGLASDLEPCPTCGEPDPSGCNSEIWGSIFVGALVATAVTGLYAWLLSSVWERLSKKFSNLPSDHLLADSQWEIAVVVGGAVFFFSWVVATRYFWPRHHR